MCYSRLNTYIPVLTFSENTIEIWKRGSKTFLLELDEIQFLFRLKVLSLKAHNRGRQREENSIEERGLLSSLLPPPELERENLVGNSVGARRVRELGPKRLGSQ